MTPPATDRGLSEAVERLQLWLKTCEADNMVEAYGFDLSHTLNRDVSALLAAARREGEGATETVAKFKRLLNPVWMALVERAMCGDPPADYHTLFTFMGSGASDMSTVGEFRELMGDERQAVAETEAAQDRGAGR